MRSVPVLAGFLLVAGASGAISAPNLLAQLPSSTDRRVVLAEGTLPKDVFPDSRNRLPLIKRQSL
jgi:hypothetical protein